MGNRHRRTLEAVFTDPVSASIAWSDVETMMVHYGAVMSERAGSRVAVHLNTKVAVFHRPHPQKEAKKSTIRDVREFLTSAGLTP
jgi:hypothetical protein